MNLIVVRRITCLSISFMFALFVVRVRVLNLPISSLLNDITLIPPMIIASYYDWLFAVSIGLFFILLTAIFRRNHKVLTILFVSYVFLVVVCILIALLNIMAVRMLKVPLNYQWVYYSDFFGNSETRKGFMSFLTRPLWNHFFILSAATLAAGILLYYLAAKWAKLYYVGLVAYGASLILYFVFASIYLEKGNRNYSRLANPVVSFVNSIFVSFQDPNLLFALEPLNEPQALPVQMAFQRNTKYKPKSEIRNVILYVLESVPSEYVAGYNQKFAVTPNIKSYLKNALVFSDIYAHFPATNSSVVSILNSMYPMISYRCLTKEYPHIKWPSISSELKRYNYKTAFFHASDNRFQRMDEFLSVRKFDKISDYRDMRCNKNILVGSTPTWRFLDGIDEECMFDTYTEWLDDQKKDNPFFAILWTIQTHYPYFPGGKKKVYVNGNEDLNRYLNALHYSDEMFGKFMTDLKQRGLLESTLVVVVGDHGEAFGSHDQFGHGAELYEENVKVPLILINPEFEETKIPVVGGQVDIAPTIMDLLDLPRPKEWQGVSLFNLDMNNRAYFFNPHSYFLFGYREGNFKFIYNANWNETMVFDLSKDPEELNDLADKLPEMARQSTVRLGDWVHYHSAVINDKIGKLNARKRSKVVLSR